MAETKPNTAPQHVLNAVGTLVLWGLGQGLPGEEGWFITVDNMTMGTHDATPLGSWKVTVTRTGLPTPTGDV